MGRAAAVFATVGVLVGAITLILAPAASAGGQGLVVTGVTTTPSTVAVGDQLETDLTFTIADGTPAGQTTDLTLPAALVALPAGFDVRTADGSLVATAAISSGTPAVITFTTTGYAQTHVDVHGTAFVKDNFDAAVAPPGTTTPLKYVSGTSTFINDLTVLPGSSIDRTGAFKFGQFVRTDQGSTRADGAIYWFIESPAAPKGGWTSVEFEDQIPAGESVDCSSVKVTIGDGNGPGGGFENGTGYGQYHFAVPCGPDSLDLVTEAVSARKIVRVQFTVDLASPTGSTPTTFVNKATVTTNAVYGGTVTYPAAGSLVQSSAGGSASGVAPTPTTETTTPTTETTTPTTETTQTTSTVGTPTTTVVVLPTSSTESTPSSVTTQSSTPIPLSPTLSSPISTTSDGTTIQVLPTSDSSAPPTSPSASGTSTDSVTTSVLATTTTSAALASTGAPVESAAMAGFLLLLAGSGLLALTMRRRGRHHLSRHS